MRPFLTALCAAFLLGLVTTPSAHAAVPSAANSTVEPCFVTCPYGDISFTVVVRDAASNPIGGSNVQIVYTNCPGFTLCPNQETGTTVNLVTHTVGRFTDASGILVFHVHAGGLCIGAQLKIVADGVHLADRTLASTDQDGNLIVDPVDQAIVIGKVGGGDLSADLDCDAAVTAADVGVLNNHMGHSCDAATPAIPKSWGSLKITYR